MATYEQEIELFEKKYGITVDFDVLNVEANRFQYLDDNLFEKGTRDLNSFRYKSYFTQLLNSYVYKKTDITFGEANYSLSELSLFQFIDDYERLMKAKHEANPEDKRKRADFEGLKDQMLGIAKECTKKFDTSLGNIWAYKLTHDKMKYDDFQRFVESELKDVMYGKDLPKYSESIANIYTAQIAMQKAWKDTSIFQIVIHPIDSIRQYLLLGKLNKSVDYFKSLGENCPTEGNFISGSMLKDTLDEVRKFEEQNKPKKETKPEKESNLANSNKESVNADKPLVADGKIKCWKDSDNLFRDPKVSEDYQKRFYGMLGEYKDEWMREHAAFNVFNSMRIMSDMLWEEFDGLSGKIGNVVIPRTDAEREAYIQNRARIGAENIYKVIGDSNMTVAQKLIMAQKVANIGLTEFSPVAAYSKYAQYGDNYFINNATPDDIRNLTGYEGDVNELIHDVKVGLGIEKEQIPNIIDDVNNVNTDVKAPVITGNDNSKVIESQIKN